MWIQRCIELKFALRAKNDTNVAVSYIHSYLASLQEWANPWINLVFTRQHPSAKMAPSALLNLRWQVLKIDIFQLHSSMTGRAVWHWWARSCVACGFVQEARWVLCRQYRVFSKSPGFKTLKMIRSIHAAFQETTFLSFSERCVLADAFPILNGCSPHYQDL